MTQKTQAARKASGNQEPQTWAESVQAYQKSKKTLPWKQSELPLPQYVKQYDISRKSREMDPILMRFRDPEVEEHRRQKEAERVRTALNIAKIRQMKKEQNYNIVTHAPDLSRKQESPARPLRQPDSRTSYDILNHVARDKTRSLALIHNDGEAPEVIPQKAVIMEGGKKPHSHKRRDVDVLTNRFFENHDERMIEEQRFLRHRAEETYRRTHDYNLISGTYYDEDKEKEFVRSRNELGALQGRAQRHRLPPSMRFGDGVNLGSDDKPVHDLAECNRVADRGLGKRIRGRQAHEENIRQHEIEEHRAEQRILNRPSHMRHVEVLRTGHDVISNQVFTGREGRPPPRPRAQPPTPVWDRLSGQATGVQRRSSDGASGTLCQRPDLVDRSDDLKVSSRAGSVRGENGSASGHRANRHAGPDGGVGHARRSRKGEKEIMQEDPSCEYGGGRGARAGAAEPSNKPFVPSLPIAQHAKDCGDTC